MYDYTKFRYYPDKTVHLVKYLIKDTETSDVYYAMTEDERDMFVDLCQSDSPIVEVIDTAEYDWIDGYKLPENNIDLAIEMSQTEYERYVVESNPTYQMLDLKESNEILQGAVIELAQMISEVVSNG